MSGQSQDRNKRSKRRREYPMGKQIMTTQRVPFPLTGQREIFHICIHHSYLYRVCYLEVVHTAGTLTYSWSQSPLLESGVEWQTVWIWAKCPICAVRLAEYKYTNLWCQAEGLLMNHHEFHLIAFSLPIIKCIKCNNTSCCDQTGDTGLYLLMVCVCKLFSTACGSSTAAIHLLPRIGPIKATNEGI